MDIFDKSSFLFNICLKCLNLRKEDEDFFTFISVVNRECEKFKLEELSSDQFKCLIFVQRLISIRDVEIWAWNFIKLEQDPKQHYRLKWMNVTGL